MRLPTWLTLCRRARRNRRRLNPVPVVESLEDRTLLTIFWDFDPGIGHLEFTTDDASTTLTIQNQGGIVVVPGEGSIVPAADVVTMSVETGNGHDAIALAAGDA